MALACVGRHLRTATLQIEPSGPRGRVVLRGRSAGSGAVIEREFPRPNQICPDFSATDRPLSGSNPKRKTELLLVKEEPMPRGGDHRSKSAVLKQLEGDRRKVGRTRLDARIEREPKGRQNRWPRRIRRPTSWPNSGMFWRRRQVTILTAADQTLIENYCVAVCAARLRRTVNCGRPASLCRAPTGQRSIRSGGYGGNRSSWRA